MKGFPNQVSDLQTLSKALEVLHDLASDGQNAKDDGVFGEALVRRGVLRTGHTKIPVDEYLAEQKKKPASNQSHRTRARGLRELFRVMGLIDDSSGSVHVLALGRAVEAKHGKPAALSNWRQAIVSMIHFGGDTTFSHPYQVLLRLMARVEGITRAKCALALEAKDDSEEELERIANLAALDEAMIVKEIGVTQSTWDNAKKILPSFAEQLGDASKHASGRMFLAKSPGGAQPIGEPESIAAAKPAASRGATKVSAAEIAKAGLAEDWNENNAPTVQELDPDAIASRKAKLKDRHARHNAIVRKLAALLEAQGMSLYENPFDCLAAGQIFGLLIEVKSLDGTAADEADQVRAALAQLLYYEAFATVADVRGKPLFRVACFEHQISKDHISWLEKSSILTVWPEGDALGGSSEALHLIMGASSR